VAVDAQVVADAKRCGIDEADACAVAFSRVEKADQDQQGTRDPFDKTVVAHEVWEFASQVLPDL